MLQSRDRPSYQFFFFFEFDEMDEWNRILSRDFFNFEIRTSGKYPKKNKKWPQKRLE